MNTIASIAIDIFVLIFASIALLTSVGTLFLIFYHRQQSPMNTPTILICNTYVSIIFTCVILLDMYGHNLCGDLYSNISFDNWWCYGRTYLLHTELCLLYHSYLLQAIFRFCRVVLYKHKRLQTFQFISSLILIQWLIGFLFMLPILFLHHFQYVPEYYYCEILLSDSLGLMLTGAITYSLPMGIIGGIYFYILYYMQKTRSQSVLRNRQQANQRDLVVLRRIIILLGLLVTLGFPTFFIWLGYMLTGYVNSIGYHLGWSMFTFSLSSLPSTFVLLTPQLRKLLMITIRKNQRIQPIMITEKK